MRFLPLLFALLLAGCTSRTDVVLPLSRGIVSASQVTAVEIDVRSTAIATVAALDDAAKARTGPAGQALAILLPDVIMRATRTAGLTQGRAIKLLVELDHLQAASAGRALFGTEDRLAGTVFVRDAETGTALGQLYIDVNSRTSGWMALATRGGLRERMVEAFADRVSKALGGRT